MLGALPIECTGTELFLLTLQKVRKTPHMPGISAGPQARISEAVALRAGNTSRNSCSLFLIIEATQQ